LAERAPGEDGRGESSSINNEYGQRSRGQKRGTTIIITPDKNEKKKFQSIMWPVIFVHLCPKKEVWRAKKM
jgi:hypothetical protein